MNAQEFESYCKDYSKDGDKAEFFDRYYADNAVFEHPIKGESIGKEAIVGFWTAGHQGIHEVLEPLDVLIEGNRIAAEVRVEWHCQEDTNYLGLREKGRVYHAESAVFFHLKDGKIIRVKLYLNTVAQAPEEN